ncbi:MAG: BrnT family toxin [Hyphomicrobium sp.]
MIALNGTTTSREKTSTSTWSASSVPLRSSTTIFSITVRDDAAVEERWQTIGMDIDRILVVVWTERYENRIRIISARKANRKEQDRYYRQALS